MCMKAIYSKFNILLKKNIIQNCTFMYYLSRFYSDDHQHTTLDLPLIKTFLVNFCFILVVLKGIIDNISPCFFYHCKRFYNDRIKIAEYVHQKNPAVSVVNIAI